MKNRVTNLNSLIVIFLISALGFSTAFAQSLNPQLIPLDDQEITTEDSYPSDNLSTQLLPVNISPDYQSFPADEKVQVFSFFH